MTESLRIPCGPIHSTNSCVPCLVMKGEAQWINRHPRVNSDTLEPSNLMLGPRRGRHCGRDEQSITAAQLCLRSLGKPWQRALSEVLRHSPLRNSCCSFFFLPGHLLAKPRRKGKGKTQEEGKADRERRKMMLVERRKECRKEKTQWIAHGGCHKRAH